MPVIEHRAFARVGDLERLLQPAFPEPGEHVGRAGQNGRDARAVIKLAERQSVRVGMLIHFHHFRDHELFPVPGQPGIFVLQLAFGLLHAHQQDAFHFQTNACHQIGKLFNTNPFQVDVIFYPT